MKIKKILCSLALTSSASITLSPLTSCGLNNKYSDLVKSVVNKLVEMDKYPRCTSVGQRSNLDAIRVWIIKEAINSGVSYNSIHADEYGNIWFDVAATKGYENYNTLILQGHMDMVVAGLTDEEKNITPIEVEVEWDKGIVHSKNYKTSIGADDGVSLAIVFTLLQDSSFKHGPLRVIFTADEDSGMIGASNLANNHSYIIQKTGPLSEGEDIKYLLNLDAEDVGDVYRSCFGSETFTYSQNQIPASKETIFSNHLCLDIKGFKGGHSGGDIPLGRANADKCIYEILNEASQFQSYQIIKHYHPDEEGKDISYQRNQIIPHAQLLFNSQVSKTILQQTIDQKIAKWKEVYTDEDWSKVSITLSDITDAETYKTFLSSEDSLEVVKNVGANSNPKNMVEDGTLWYGSMSNQQGKVLKSANISPIEIKFNNSYSVKVVSQFRTSTNEILSEMSDYYNKKVKLFNTSSGSYYPALEYDETKQELNDIVCKAYKNESIEPKLVDSTGGYENTYWVDCSPNLHCSSIGPTIKDAHKTTETLKIDTIQPVLNVVKYVCEQMKK